MVHFRTPGLKMLNNGDAHLQIPLLIIIIAPRHVAREYQGVRRTPWEWRPPWDWVRPRLNFIWLVFRLGQQSADCGEQEQRSYSATRELKVQSPNISAAASEADVSRATTVEDLDVRLYQAVNIGHIRGELHDLENLECAIMRAAAVCTTSSAKFIDAETLHATSGINIWYFCEGKRDRDLQ